jgi:DNA-binding SARP family transcriptional activator
VCGQTEPSLVLELQGGFSLMRDGVPWEIPLSAQRVLAFLGMHERPLLRIYVSGMLWPGSSERRAAASLRTALWRVHDGPGSPLAASGTRLRLRDSVAVDVRDTRSAVRRILGEFGMCAGDVDRLVYARDLLPDWYEDWVLLEREQLREQRIRALEKLCCELTAKGRYAEAAQAGLAAVACEPLRESSHRALISLHLAEGNASEALRRYAAYREMLKCKLGLVPSERMEQLLDGLSRRRVSRLAG